MTQPLYTPPTLTPSHPLPPRTRGLPLIGSLPALLRQPHQFLLDARSQYGDLYRLNLGVTDAFVIGAPAYAQHVLADNARNYYKGGAFWEPARKLVGNGIAVSEGEYWLRQRRMMQPHFHRQRLARLADDMVAGIEGGMNAWQITPGKPFEIGSAYAHLVMTGVVNMLFGSSISPTDAAIVGHAMETAMAFVFRGIIGNSLPDWFPMPGTRQYQQAIRTIDTYLYRLIEQCRQNPDGTPSVLALLMDTVDDATGERMTDAQLRDEILTLFLGGFDTTSISLAWTIDMLQRNQAALTQLVTEIDEVLGQRQPTFDDLMKLPYTRMVFNEALRLRPITWVIPRDAREDDEIGGQHIPAGALMLILVYAIHQHPHHWADAERFDPLRFTPEAMASRHKLAWMPFGHGQRQCIGKDFALMQATLMLVMTLQRFSLQPTQASPTPIALSTMLRPRVHIQAAFTPR